MYQPQHFREDRLAVQHALIREHALGLLITAGPGGLQANHIPFLVDADGSPHGKVRAHLARANPQWRELSAVDECLVVFQGPQQYISPSLYPTKHEHGKAVPTWNYITVHAWGRPQVIDDVTWLRRQVDDLTSHKESALPAPWAVSDAPAPYVAAQLRGIVGIEIPIARIEGKWKVSQNRPAIDKAGVVKGLRGSGSDAEPMAALVEERGKAAY
ncbi:MAG: FMN-binding negative transcriptional regulator [Rhizobiales bacterium]|nr:FMN-binding negative transcriptional regulator [Hyphomicrobiales bacterium]